MKEPCKKVEKKPYHPPKLILIYYPDLAKSSGQTGQSDGGRVKRFTGKPT
jgi:hypothetical protein